MIDAPPELAGPGRACVERLVWGLWVALLITIPFTSSPLVSHLVGGAVVAPLAGLPLLGLLVVWLLPYVVSGSSIPRLAVPLLVFVAVAALTTASATFQGVLPELGIEVVGWEVRALATVGIGVSFYLAAAMYPRTDRSLRESLRCLYLGGVLMLLWSTLQAAFVVRGVPYPEPMKEFHVLLSNRPLVVGRVTGMAYEPSWVANLLMILYLPLWTGSVLSGYSAYRTRISRIPVELPLLVWGVVVLLLSLSRVGLASALLVISALTLWQFSRLSRTWAGGVASWLGLARARRARLIVEAIRFGMFALAIAGLVVLAFGLVGASATLNSRIGRVFETDFREILSESPTPLFAIANRLAYAERLVYWDAGLRIFGDHPLLGVGLGNTGFFFRKTVNSYGYRLPEVIRLLGGDPGLANPKNLWVRLLSETGIVGALVFVTWLVVMAAAAWTLTKGPRRIHAAVGAAGLMTLIAQLTEGFSLDSFALPQLWIVLGFVTAAAQLAYSTPAGSDEA